ncbi:MAG: hypothetical protein GDA36_05700 [Rhodobacteraceae bacterium]|nr:hypothetical protein [Paracoccaceae bacterium]
MSVASSRTLFGPLPKLLPRLRAGPFGTRCSSDVPCGYSKGPPWAVKIFLYAGDKRPGAFILPDNGDSTGIISTRNIPE